MSNGYILYGWNASHFSTKLRAYLTCKQIEFNQKECSLFDLAYLLPKRIGSSSMPALKSGDGNWLSDTHEIIEKLENTHEHLSLTPTSPRQRIASLLFENWVDDAWLKLSVHTRWSYPENFENLLKQETGKSLAPFLPGAFREWLSKKVFAETIKGYMPRLGIIPEQIPLLEKWALNLLKLLDQHFQQYAFILGDKPSIADFALAGAVCGHLARDPWPKNNWVVNHKNLLRWAEDIFKPNSKDSNYPEADEIPETLTPIFKIIAQEYFPLIKNSAEKVHDLCQIKHLKSRDVLPRIVKDIEYPMMDETFVSGTFTYSLWRMQLIQKQNETMSDTEKQRVDEWFTTLNLPRLSGIDFGPAMQRHKLGARLA